MTSSFYKDLLDPAMENNSDVSEIGPEDLENMVKGVDDIDDALFGFKPKQKDVQKSVSKKAETKPLDRPKSAIKKQLNVSDFPEEDPLADISLSDDDFFNLGNKSPSVPKRENISSASKMASQDKLTKSKKIANLFGLDDEEDVVTKSKKQESAADWLGIKESPAKTFPDRDREELLKMQTPKMGLTDGSLIEDSQKISLPDFKNTSISRFSKGEVGSGSVKTQQIEDKPTEKLKQNPAKQSGNVFDLLGDKNEQPKNTENPKDKKSAIFDELFGDNILGQKPKSRRNSLVKTPETTKNEDAARDTPLSEPQDDSTTALGQYVPSVASSKRPGVGRRRETAPPPLTPQPSLSLFQDDWLKSPDQPTEPKKETAKPTQAESKFSGIEVNESLPTWLGGSGIGTTPETKQGLKQPTNPVEETPLKKPAPLGQTQGLGKNTELENLSTKKPEVPLVDSLREALATSTETTHQTALALQRTEAQLLTALQMQTTQSGLSAVCARQRSLLDNQEKQLTQLVAQQTDRQALLEKQLTAQQLRIQQLLEVLTENITGSQVATALQPETTGISAADNGQQSGETIKDLEREIHKATIENEELRLRMTLMEKHYKMEYESLQIQHRREIESWEEKLTMQKELTDQLCEDYRERIKRLKENHAELLAQHNERVQQMREEKAEDIRQLMEFHKTTLEQMMTISKLIAPVLREEQKISFQTWKPLDTSQLSEREEELLKKENTLKALQEKLEAQKTILEKRSEEIEEKAEQETMKYEEISRQLKHEKIQLKFQQQKLQQEKKHMEEQYHEQRKQLEEMQERIISEQTQVSSEKLKLAEEKAKLDALAKLQGVSGSASFDVLKSKAEVHGALEAARNAELKAVEERKRLREKERQLDMERWRLKEMEEDLVSRAEHLDRLMQVSEANHQAGQKALEEAKQLEKKAEEKLREVEKRKSELREKEKNLMKMKLDIAQEEVRLDYKREQLKHILPPLSSDEASTLQPMKDVIDPKLLIMRLRAEREFEAGSRLQQSKMDKVIPKSHT